MTTERTAAEPRFSIFAFGVTLIVLGMAVPLILSVAITDQGRSSAWVVTSIVMLWSSSHLAVIIGRGTVRLFAFIWWLFVYVFMGLAPTVQIRSGEFPSTTLGISPTTDLPAALVVIAGLIAFEVGSIAAITLRRQRSINAVRPAVPISTGRVLLVTVLGLLLAGVVVAQTGAGNLFVARNDSARITSNAFDSSSLLALLNAGATYGLLVGIHGLTWIRRSASYLGERRPYLLLLVVALVALLVFKNPVSSARYTVGVIIFSLIVLAGSFDTVRRARASFVSIIVALFGVFPIADAFRRGTSGSFTRLGFFEEYRSGDYDAFAQIANTLSYLDEQPIVIGRQLTGVVLFWVPRVIWQDKPVDTGTLLASFRGYSFRNLSAPVWAELLINGGMLAVVLGLALLGWVLVLADRRLSTGFASGGTWAILGAILPFYLLLVYRGSLLQATSGLVAILVITLFVRERSATQATQTYSAATQRRGSRSFAGARVP